MRYPLPVALLAALLSTAGAFAACGDGGATISGSSGQGGSAGAGGGGGSGGPAGASGAAGAGGAGEPPFCGTAGISKGPWVASVDGSTALVRWESCVAGPTQLTVTPEAGGAARAVEGTSSVHEVLTLVKSIAADRGADLPGTWTLHEVRIDALQPSTCYRYEAAGEASGRLCTARAPGEPLRFAFIADTNPGLDVKAATSLFETIAAFRPDLTLHGGDMQYYSSGLEPYAWWFGAMAPLLRAGVMWPAVGNHESEKTDEFEDYYSRFWGAIGSDNVAHSYHFASAGVHFFSLNTEEHLLADSPQYAWASQQLAAATKQPGYRFSVVFFHRPLATCGDSQELADERAVLQPLFKANGVRLVLAGHMHGYERFDLDGTPYFVAGGGAALIGDVEANLQRSLCSQRQAHGAFAHLLTFELDGTTLSGKAIDSLGQTRDSFSFAVP